MCRLRYKIVYFFLVLLVPVCSDAVSTCRESIVEYHLTTKIAKQPQMTFFFRYPQGVEDGKKVNGVLALCLLTKDAEKIRRMLDKSGASNEQNDLIQFADDNKLAILCWTSSTLWNPRKNWTDESRQEARRVDEDCDDMASAWRKGVNALVKKYGLPAENYLLWGFSGSAQYAARLALRHPHCFSAVHIHVPSSFDVPTEKAKQILWCLTTGENEVGYHNSLQFLVECQKLGYAILYKAIPNLSHGRSKQASKLGLEFFKYSLDKWLFYRKQGCSAREIKERIYADFMSSKHIGDVLNQCIYEKDDFIFVDKNFQVPIPTKTLCDDWRSW